MVFPPILLHCQCRLEMTIIIDITLFDLEHFLEENKQQLFNVELVPSLNNYSLQFILLY